MTILYDVYKHITSSLGVVVLHTVVPQLLTYIDYDIMAYKTSDLGYIFQTT